MSIRWIYPLLRRRVQVWWCVHAIFVVILVSINLSTATYNPAYHPQNPNWNPSLQQHHQQQKQEQNYQHISWQGPARGGSTMVAPPQEELMYEHYPQRHEQHEQEQRLQEQHQQQEEIYRPPQILLKHMSMALRVTSEWNRRLRNGVNRFKFWQRRRKQQPSHPSKTLLEENYNNHHQQHYYHDAPINVHPSRAWHPPIPATAASLSDEEDIDGEELTLFHAKSPRTLSSGEDRSHMKGVACWGPELLPYLEHVVEILGISTPTSRSTTTTAERREEGEEEEAGAVEIPLAMIYLDRACSVETLRSNGVPPCPFCIPRTVHRLSLASMLLATQAVKGISQEDMKAFYYGKISSSLGIPETQLEQMVEWMRGALGDAGLSVTIPQMQEWGRHWESIFVPEHRKEDSSTLPIQPATVEEPPHQEHITQLPQTGSSSEVLEQEPEQLYR